jgi:hypothetical protein
LNLGSKPNNTTLYQELNRPLAAGALALQSNGVKENKSNHFYASRSKMSKFFYQEIGNKGHIGGRSLNIDILSNQVSTCGNSNPKNFL